MEDSVVTNAIALATVNELNNYNCWTRDRQLQAYAALTDEQFVRNLGSSFGSVRDALVHMIDTWVP